VTVVNFRHWALLPQYSGRSLRSNVFALADTGAVATKAGETLSNLLETGDARRYCFVTAKGGCGKTTTAATVALKMAEEDMSTLVISVDPAHSLGDALRVDLSDGKLHKLQPDLPLYALEVDTAEAVAEFQELVAGLKGSATGGDATEGGWSDLASVLDTIPPGADELISLIKILNLVESQTAGVDFKRIVVDCAPTGHTLRLLAFPDFLDAFLGKALSLRKKLNAASGIVNTVTKMLSRDRKVDVSAALDAASVRVEMYRQRMVELSDMLRDPARAEFVVITIPTIMAVEETKRLVNTLYDDGIWVRHVVANMIIPSDNLALQESYLRRLRSGQARELAFATEELGDEFDLDITPVFRFDSEVRGVFALRALALSAFTENRVKSYGGLFDSARTGGENTQFAFAAGKGGVGKTSVSCTMGVALADRGLKTLVISTDPAHSLGDSLDMSFAGGKPVLVENTNGLLYGMEIDTAAEVEKFKSIVKSFVAEQNKGVGADLARNLGMGEFADLLDNTPPGLDEALGLSALLDLVKAAEFERVIIGLFGRSMDCSVCGRR
jgi:arsenite/tail-anchored protein-transporting ATPase